MPLRVPHASAQIWNWDWDLLLQAQSPAPSCPRRKSLRSFKECQWPEDASRACGPYIYYRLNILQRWPMPSRYRRKPAHFPGPCSYRPGKLPLITHLPISLRLSSSGKAMRCRIAGTGWPEILCFSMLPGRAKVQFAAAVREYLSISFS